jgi:hypothetical protein
LGSGFFGLTPEYKEHILEEQFFLVKHLGISLREVLSMPTQYRRWWIQREMKYNSDVNKIREDAAKK